MRLAFSRALATALCCVLGDKHAFSGVDFTPVLAKHKPETASPCGHPLSIGVRRRFGRMQPELRTHAEARRCMEAMCLTDETRRVATARYHRPRVDYLHAHSSEAKIEAENN